MLHPRPGHDSAPHAAVIHPSGGARSSVLQTVNLRAAHQVILALAGLCDSDQRGSATGSFSAGAAPLCEQLCGRHPEPQEAKDTSSLDAWSDGDSGHRGCGTCPRSPCSGYRADFRIWVWCPSVPSPRGLGPSGAAQMGCRHALTQPSSLHGSHCSAGTRPGTCPGVMHV